MSNLAISIEPVPLREDAHGVIRVGRSRVTLDTVVSAFGEGLPAEEIVRQYPSLLLSDVYAVLSYYRLHKAEVDHYLQEQRRLGDEIQRQAEERWDPRGIRERLLARRSGS